jgi:DNA-binding FrmR family transcriptional regulator
MDADNLHKRLNRIAGQIKAIGKMIDEDIPCEDLLIQVNAVKKALRKVGQVVLEGHLNHCVREGIEHGNAVLPPEKWRSLWSLARILNSGRLPKPAPVLKNLFH